MFKTIITLSMVLVTQIYAQNDTLVVRKILDTNNLQHIGVKSVAVFENNYIAGLTFENLPTFKILPAEISSLKNLYVLRIIKTGLKELPTSICTLPKVTDLQISECFLTSLPPGISKMPVLNRLLLDHNNLASLPDDLGNPSPKSVLILSYNKLKTLPNILTRFHPGPQGFEFCFNDSMVLTKEQTEAWKVTDYKQYLYVWCTNPITIPTKYEKKFFSMVIGEKELSLRLLKKYTAVDYTICNVKGTYLKKSSMQTLREGVYTITSLESYSAGVYLLNLTLDGYSMKIKFILK
ncbi:MAG: leucine-rich repeat domain-containing protein [Chitinivibrionales bacterium]|nr:leucine-rich repeat domain-containing protein [Chitinivibrionales bacterium]